jgi:peroxiredoxin
MLAISSTHDVVSDKILEMKIFAIFQKISFASSKYCKTAILDLVSISSSSLKFSQKYDLIILSSSVKAYFAHTLFVLSNFKYPFCASLISVVIVPSFSILDLLLFNLAKNL